MDADIIRLILFLGGIALVLGIYLWDKRRKLDSKLHAIRKAQQKMAPGSGAGAGGHAPVGADSLGILAEDPFDSVDSLDDVITETATPEPVAEQETFSFAAVDDEEETVSPSDELPTKILQINIVARVGRMTAADIHRAAWEVGLIHGNMSIFHRHVNGPDSPVTFSMASIVEPGTFPADPTADFTTPGLILFAHLSGPQDGLVVFSDMLFTAERLAALLDASLQDETHSDLTKQTIEHIREEILEHRRQVQLARTKAK